MIAIEFAVILIFLVIAVFVVSKFFIKHSRRNDELVKDLNLIFFKDPKKFNQEHKKTTK